MIKVNGSIPHEVAVAVSGGPDSMAILNFLSMKRKITVVHFDHGTAHGAEAHQFVLDYCEKNGLEVKIGVADREQEHGESPEAYWRDMRYNFFHSIDLPIITAHTLQDQVENYLITSFRGANPRLIPYRNRNVFRPFMTTKKEVLTSWCDRKKVPYLIDPGNYDSKYMRSHVRNNIIPEILKCSPGFFTSIKKKVESEIY